MLVHMELRDRLETVDWVSADRYKIALPPFCDGLRLDFLGRDARPKMRTAANWQTHGLIAPIGEII
jgi:hypothetical protein